MHANTLFVLQQWVSPCLVHLHDGDVLRFTTQQDHRGCGDIYLGHIVRVVPHLHAFFVNIGGDQNAFLPNKWAQGDPHVGQPVLVQIHKEPYQHKSAQVSMHIQLLGQCLVIFPQKKGVVRLSPRLCVRTGEPLARAVASHCQNKAVTIRYEAGQHQVEEVLSELQRLEHVWQEVQRRFLVTYTPGLLYREPDFMLSALRQAQWYGVNALYADTRPLQQQIIQWQQQKKLFFAPHVIVEHRMPDFHHMMPQLYASYHPVVALTKGGCLHIHETEAATFIDVNSGAADHYADINTCAAQQIAKEIVLRELSGVIIIDFVNLFSNEHKKDTLQKLRDVLRHDRQTRTIAVLAPTPLVHIIRRRVVPSLRERALEACPSCIGQGVVQTTHTQFMRCFADILCFLPRYETSQWTIEVLVNASLYAYRMTIEYPPCCDLLGRVLWRMDHTQSSYKIVVKKATKY